VVLWVRAGNLQNSIIANSGRKYLDIEANPGKLFICVVSVPVAPGTPYFGLIQSDCNLKKKAARTGGPRFLRVAIQPATASMSFASMSKLE
jgi:hypothetical protein